MVREKEGKRKRAGWVGGGLFEFINVRERPRGGGEREREREHLSFSQSLNESIVLLPESSKRANVVITGTPTSLITFTLLCAPLKYCQYRSLHLSQLSIASLHKNIQH